MLISSLWQAVLRYMVLGAKGHFGDDLIKNTEKVLFRRSTSVRKSGSLAPKLVANKS